MKLTILVLSGTETANPMKGILAISKYLKLGIPEAKNLVASLPIDLNVGILSAPQLEEFTDALVSCGINAEEKPLPLICGQPLSPTLFLSYIKALYHLETGIVLCQSVLKHSSDASRTVLFSQRLTDAKEGLKKLYSLNLLPLRYRHLVPVCQFKDYLESGICTEPEGPEGVYALYEKELGAQKITNLMNTAAGDYSSLSQHQYSLFLAMQKASTLRYTTAPEELASLLLQMEKDESILLKIFGLV